MKFTIPVKPLSVNKAWKGQKFKTREHTIYEKDVNYFLPPAPECMKGELTAHYIFYLKNYKGSDTGNFEKILSDILVKAGFMEDDRFIKRLILEKEPVIDIDGERIEVSLEPYVR